MIASNAMMVMTKIYQMNAHKYGGPQVSRQNLKEASQQKLSLQKFL